MEDKRIKTAVMKNFSLAYPAKKVLKDVSCELYRGEITFITGASGVGKTSFLHLFNRLMDNVSSAETAGELNLLLDEKWTSIYPQFQMALADLRSKIALVLQTPQLLPWSIRQNFTLPLKLVKKLPAEECLERMEQHLKDVYLWEELKNYIDKPAKELSVGQQQRLCLARALAMRPDFLVLDEPTAALDAHSSRLIMELLQELKNKHTILIVSHKQNEWEKHADKVWLIQNQTLRALS
ncbi:MAG: ATP-binding cassette domain-containing protein [Oligoflexales bacterium]|nr:ATP-binding cassette domain-containing protein [Oligoflexales bacterium]